MNPHDLSPAGVRRSWLTAVVRELQMAAGRMATKDPDEIRPMLTNLPGLLPPPANDAERTMLHGLLLEAAYRCGDRARTDA
jgi:hypothetical protein